MCLSVYSDPDMNEQILLKQFFDAVAHATESDLSFGITHGPVSLETDNDSSRVHFAVTRMDSVEGVDRGTVHHQQLADFIRTRCKQA